MTSNQRKWLYNTFEEDFQNLPIEEKIVVDLDLTKPFNENQNIILKNVSHDICKGMFGKNYAKSAGGIWCVRDKETYYDICETTSICSEMIKALRSLYSGKKYVRRNVYSGQIKRNVYKIYKNQQIYKHLNKGKKIQFVILYFSPDKMDRLEKEIQIAIRTKAIYWSPNSIQAKMIDDMKKMRSE